MSTNGSPPEEFVLPAEVRDALLRYLVGRPYMEVAEGIAMLQNLLPLSRPEAEQDRHSVERLGE